MPWTIEQTCTLPHASSVVFDALTSPEALRAWFAEHVVVEPRPGGAYHFWGKHTPACDNPQRISRFEPGAHFAFSWPLYRTVTEVAVALHAAENGTTLSLTHRGVDELATTRPRELVDDFWRLALGNLGEYLKGGSGVVRPDFSDPSPEIHLTKCIPAAADVVWRALTEADSVNQWLNTTQAVVDPRVGGAYRVGWRYTIDGKEVVGGPTTILEIDEPHRLQLDWPDWRGDATLDGQTITFCLFPDHGGTKLTFIHAGFTRASDLSDYPFGWAWFLDAFEKEVLRLDGEVNPRE